MHIAENAPCTEVIKKHVYNNINATYRGLLLHLRLFLGVDYNIYMFTPVMRTDLKQ